MSQFLTITKINVRSKLLFISGSKSPHLLEHSGWTDDADEALEDEIDPRLVVHGFWRTLDHCYEMID